jgi:hypothetical protein
VRHDFFCQSWQRNSNAMVKDTSIWLRDEKAGSDNDKIAGSKSPKYFG